MRRWTWGLILLCGCVGHPLGADWEGLDETAKQERSVEALRELVTGGERGGGDAFEDREVSHCDAEKVVYVPEGSSDVSTLYWADVEAVESQQHDTLPSRPETIYLFLRPESPSTTSVKDAVTPLLAGLGLSRPYVELRSRPRWARNRLVSALDFLRASAITPLKTAPEPEPEPEPKPEPEPEEPDAKTPGDLDSVEAKLERLKEWHRKKLISDAEYETKKQELLKKL